MKISTRAHSGPPIALAPPRIVAGPLESDDAAALARSMADIIRDDPTLTPADVADLWRQASREAARGGM